MPNTHYRNAEGDWLLIGLSKAETREVEGLDAVSPLLANGHLSWGFEGLPNSALERRWLALYLKHQRALAKHSCE